MILTGTEIQQQVERGTIEISDFQSERLSPNAYDLRLGSVIYRHRAEVLDFRQPIDQVEAVEIPDDGLVIRANELWCGTSAEIITSAEFVPLLHAKSGIARLGLFVHITADLLHVGFRGRPTFQLFATLPVRLRRDFPIAQLSFWRTFDVLNQRRERDG